MKKILGNICTAALTVLFFTACADLDMPSDGRMQLNDVFKDYSYTKNYYNQCYTALRTPVTGFYYGNALLASFCDEAHDASDGVSGSVNDWYNNRMTATNNPLGDVWGYYFESIRKCNTFLQCINDTEISTATIDPEERTGWIGEVRTLRAYYYLQLIKRYGGVPIVETPYEVGYDYSGEKRASFETCVDFIIADCDAALALSESSKAAVGFRWNVSDAESNIVTRAFACAVKSQAALYAASPLWASNGTGKYTWQKAAEITGDALKQCLDHGFQLFDNTPDPDVAQNAYAYYFIRPADASRSVDKETIFQAANRLQVWSLSATPMTAGASKAGSCPSQELVDAYEMQATGLAPITGYADADHLQPTINDASGYDPAKPYEGRDPRFYASIYYNGAPRSLAGAGAGGVVTFPMSFVLSSASGDLTGTDNGDGSVTLTTTGGDPYIQTTAIDGKLPANALSRKIIFEYKSNKDVSNAEFFWGFNGSFAGGVETFPVIELPQADDWAVYEYDLNQLNPEDKNIDYWGWGTNENTHNLRFDPAMSSGYEITIRNLRVECEIITTPSVPVEMYAGGNCELNSNPSETRYTRTGYYLRKFNSYKSNSELDDDGYMRIYRLGELYLNFAEAAYNAVGPDAAVNGMSARAAVNAIRDRANMPDLPSGLTKEQFETRYRNERRVELAFEEHRFFDVRRWKILGKTDAFVTGVNTADNNGTYSYTRFKLKNRGTDADKYLILPIPQSEVTKMSNYTGDNWQNPGWN